MLLLQKLPFAALLHVFTSAKHFCFQEKVLILIQTSSRKEGPLWLGFQLVEINLVLLPDTYHFNLKPLDTVQHTIKSGTK